MADQQETKSAVNWDSKEAPYQAYLELLQQYRFFSFALKNKRGLRKVLPSFQSALATFRLTVLGQFNKYLDSAEYKKDFQNSQIQKIDYARLHNENIHPTKLLVMTEILLYWAQEHGPFATLTEKQDPRKAW